MKHLKLFENSTNYNLEEFLKQKEKLYSSIEQYYLLDDWKIEIIDVKHSITFDGKDTIEMEITETDTDQTYTMNLDEPDYNQLLKFLENPEMYISAKKYNL